MLSQDTESYPPHSTPHSFGLHSSVSVFESFALLPLTTDCTMAPTLKHTSTSQMPAIKERTSFSKMRTVLEERTSSLQLSLTQNADDLPIRERQAFAMIQMLLRVSVCSMSSKQKFRF